MSASNESLSGDTVTVFTQNSHSFVIGSGKIRTFEFLEASKGVVSIIERFGKTFAPVRYDMNGNISKIAQKYHQNPQEYFYLEDMLLAEKAQGGNVATDALQWLKRGLHFIVKFFQCIVDDNEKSENLAPFLKKAYSETLEMYHGWMGTQLFGVISKFVPARRELFYKLALERYDKADFVLRDMRVFTVQLSACVSKLMDFYTVHNLETHHRSR